MRLPPELWLAAADHVPGSKGLAVQASAALLGAVGVPHLVPITEATTADLIELALAQRVSPNDLMCCAAGRGHVAAIEVCVKHGADNWRAAMSHAADGGHIAVMALCAERKPVTDNCNMALCFAAGGGHIAAVEWCAERGADDWDCALWWAAEDGHVAAMALCADHGADCWNPALQHAAQNNHLAAVALCAERGTDLDWDDARATTSDPATLALITKLEQ